MGIKGRGFGLSGRERSGWFVLDEEKERAVDDSEHKVAHSKRLRVIPDAFLPIARADCVVRCSRCWIATGKFSFFELKRVKAHDNDRVQA